MCSGKTKRIRCTIKFGVHFQHKHTDLTDTTTNLPARTKRSLCRTLKPTILPNKALTLVRISFLTFEKDFQNRNDFRSSFCRDYK